MDTTTTTEAAATTDELLEQLFAEAELEGANPARFEQGPWVGVIGDECWITALGYDRGPFTPEAHPRDQRVALVLPELARRVSRVVVSTRSVAFHTPPLHNGAPVPPQVNSSRAVIAFIP